MVSSRMSLLITKSLFLHWYILRMSCLWPKLYSINELNNHNIFDLSSWSRIWFFILVGIKMFVSIFCRTITWSIIVEKNCKNGPFDLIWSNFFGKTADGQMKSIFRTGCWCIQDIKSWIVLNKHSKFELALTAPQWWRYHESPPLIRRSSVQTQTLAKVF